MSSFINRIKNSLAEGDFRASVGAAAPPRSFHPPAGTPYTKYARKYGALKGVEFSGRTPIEPFPATTGPTHRGGLRKWLIELQKHHCEQFTAQELVDRRANITVDDPIKDDYLRNMMSLTNGIHPCFERNRWCFTGDQYYKPQEIDPAIGNGYWLASNDTVWHALYPILQIATRMLYNLRKNEFVQAIRHGKRNIIPANRLPNPLPPYYPDPATYVSLQPASKSIQLQDSTEAFVDTLEKYVVFRFDEAKDNRRAIRSNGMTGTCALMTPNGDEKPLITIELSVHCVEPLFIPGITDAEILAYQYKAAQILIHECGHALGRIADYEMDLAAHRLAGGSAPYRLRIRPELYWKDQPVAEIGYALEQSALGAMMESAGWTINMESRLYAVSMVWSQFPTEWNKRYHPTWSQDLNPTAPLSNRRTIYPVPIKHMENVHKDSFWNFMIKKYGPNMLELAQPLEGKEFERNARGEQWELFSGPTRFSPLWRKDVITKRKEAIETGACRSLEDKLMITVGYRLITQSDSLADFVDTTQRQLSALEAYNQNLSIEHGMAQAGKDKNPHQLLAQERLMEQHDLIRDLVMSHKRTVEDFRRLDVVDNAYISQRTNLMRFNTGIRTMLRSVGKSWRTILPQAYEPLDLELEFARMGIFDPRNNALLQQYATNEMTTVTEIIDAFEAIKRGEIEDAPEPWIKQIHQELQYQDDSVLWLRSFASYMANGIDYYRGGFIRVGLEDNVEEQMSENYNTLIKLRDGDKETGNEGCSNWHDALSIVIDSIKDMNEYILTSIGFTREPAAPMDIVEDDPWRSAPMTYILECG